MKKKVETEQETELYAAVGRALSRWGVVEHHLCSIYSRTVQPDPTAPVGTVWASFYAIDSFRAKLKMVDAAIRIRWHGHEKILTEWGKINKRAADRNNNRNDLAHGVVMNFGVPQHTYYVPSFVKGLLAQIPSILSALSPTLSALLPERRLTAKEIADRQQGFRLLELRLTKFQELLASAEEAAKKPQSTSA